MQQGRGCDVGSAYGSGRHATAHKRWRERRLPGVAMCSKDQPTPAAAAYAWLRWSMYTVIKLSCAHVLLLCAVFAT